jgi:hypothetical protein
MHFWHQFKIRKQMVSWMPGRDDKAGQGKSRWRFAASSSKYL